ncbi:MAG: AsmA family protein [Acidobacteria bacterium]|nr:AsmA family protein [Acidobacteriota bacterium]MBS1866040.1 AsmA family protein [Acidobacteriota bacterium]
MARLRKYWKLSAALVLFVVVAQVAVNSVLRANRVRRAMILRLERTFGRQVEVQMFSFALLPLPSLDAEGITVGEDPAFGDEYFLRADRLSARLRLLGLIRGRFEFGTLSLEKPSLILVKNGAGRWNLERWLPPAFQNANGQSKSYGPPVEDVATNRLAKIEITEGRLNFKLADDKKPFAFTDVKGSIEQVTFGRWQINLEAQPWRSGVQLQSAGTIEVRGEVAGTSARLRPARLQIRWSQASLADLVRLSRGQDEGVRGLFDLDATAESGTKEFHADAAPGEWAFSVNARASQIHRWDMASRADDPRLDLRTKGRWFPSDGTINIEEMLVSAPRSNFRGSAMFTTVPQTNFRVRVDSAGIQASDLLAWYRAFQPGVAEGVSADQYFTGGATLSGWPIRLETAAFSSLGGRLSIPGFAAPARIGPARGGMEKNSFVMDAATISWRPPAPASGNPRDSQKEKVGASKPVSNSLAVGMLYDFDSSEGYAGLSGQSETTEEIFKAATAFGKQLNRGWEWNGQTSADLRFYWGKGSQPGWQGQIEFAKGDLEIAGLNRPVKVKNAAVRWIHGQKSVAIAQVEAVGGLWSGDLTENTDTSEDAPRWLFHLHTDSLSAADLDLWAGPRARPNWLQRLLPAMLGGNPSQGADISDLLRRVNVAGELSVGDFILDKFKLKQLHGQLSLHDLKLNLHDAQALWAGGTLQGSLSASFDVKPTYQLKIQASGLNLAQVPLAGRVADRMAGTFGGTLNLETEGVGREVLLDKLKGEGRIQLKKTEFRGWDLQASLASGAPHAGASRWAEGDGVFHIGNRSLEVNHLRLRAPQQEISLKGSVSFGRQADLTVESAGSTGGKNKASGPEHVMQLTGPLEGPKVAIQAVSAQQPGD